jgi:hypothetical protein
LRSVVVREPLCLGQCGKFWAITCVWTYHGFRTTSLSDVQFAEWPAATAATFASCNCVMSASSSVRFADSADDAVADAAADVAVDVASAAGAHLAAVRLASKARPAQVLFMIRSCWSILVTEIGTNSAAPGNLCARDARQVDERFISR